MPDPEKRARLEAMLQNPGVSEGMKAKIRAGLASTAGAAPAPRDLGGYSVQPGEAQIGGGGPPAPGGSPYDRFKAPAAPVRTGNPEAEQPGPSPSASRADAVLGYLRSGLHGADRAITGGLGTRLGDWVDPGTKARGEAAAEQYPVGEVLGMLGGALSPAGLAGRAGQLGNAAAQAAVKGGGALAKIGRGIVGGAVGGAAQEAGEGALSDRPTDVGRAATVGGVIGGGLGALGAAAGGISKAIRDPAEQMGRDIASAEKVGGGTQFWGWRGAAKGPTYEAAEQAARAETAAGSPISPSGVADRKAVPALGNAVQGDISGRLGAMRAENAAVPQDELVSLQPMVSRAVKKLQGIVRDQKALPSQTPRTLAREIRQSANVRVVDWTDETLNQVPPENMLEAGFAKTVGLIRDEGDLSGKFVVLEPRSVSPGELEMIRRGYDSKAGDFAKRSKGIAGDYRELAGGARDARAQLGPEAAARAERHAASHGETENVVHAARLPKGTENVDLRSTETQEALGGALQRYRTRGNESADRVLDQLAGNGPLRGALDESAGVAAIERLRREGGGPRPGAPAYGMMDSAKLRADALARYLEDKVGATARPIGRGFVPAASSAAARRDR